MMSAREPPDRHSLLQALEAKDSARPIDYEYGTTGPKEADELEKRLGFVAA
jgi:hypothetical protein